MTRYLVRRMLEAIPTLFFLTVIAFFFIDAAPGDVVDILIDPVFAKEQGPEGLAAMRRQFGLDQPVPIQYANWLGQVARGNLGYSFIHRRPVTVMIQERLWGTLQLSIPALILAVILGITVGVISGLRQYSLLDHTVSILSYGAWSLPNFYLGLILIYLFAVQLRWLPSAGMFAPNAEFDLLDRLRHLILPILVLSVQFIGLFARQTRSAMLEIIGSEYVNTARAKGLRERVVTLRHMLPNALIPIITVIGMSFPLLITGAIITETVFAWSGMGALTMSAILSRDYPVLMGIIFVVGLGVLVLNLVIDVLYAVVDPRIRYS
ncbi:MAG: ABC transporter permease [Chloroflexi bacterium]|nr:ABC transporter permease [Chloroflexota bacterium]